MTQPSTLGYFELCSYEASKHGTVLFEKETVPQLLKKFHPFYETSRFSTVCRIVYHLSLAFRVLRLD